MAATFQERLVQGKTIPTVGNLAWRNASSLKRSTIAVSAAKFEKNEPRSNLHQDPAKPATLAK